MVPGSRRRHLAIADRHKASKVRDELKFGRALGPELESCGRKKRHRSSLHTVITQCLTASFPKSGPCTSVPGPARRQQVPTEAVARALRSNATLPTDRDLLLLRKPPQVRFLQPAKASVMAASATCIKHSGLRWLPLQCFTMLRLSFCI